MLDLWGIVIKVNDLEFDGKFDGNKSLYAESYFLVEHDGRGKATGIKYQWTEGELPGLYKAIYSKKAEVFVHDMFLKSFSIEAADKKRIIVSASVDVDGRGEHVITDSFDPFAEGKKLEYTLREISISTADGVDVSLKIEQLAEDVTADEQKNGGIPGCEFRSFFDVKYS